MIAKTIFQASLKFISRKKLAQGMAFVLEKK